MNSWTALAKIAAGPTGPESRKHPRFRANTLACDQGEVLDLSATGLRIRFRVKSFDHPPGQTVQLTLLSQRGEHCLPVTVVWVKKDGRKHFEVGFQFPDAETAKSAQLFRAAWDPIADGEWTNR